MNDLAVDAKTPWGAPSRDPRSDRWEDNDNMDDEEDESDESGEEIDRSKLANDIFRVLLVTNMLVAEEEGPFVDFNRARRGPTDHGMQWPRPN